MNITLSHISYNYEDSPQQALAPISASFPEGWTGIVGGNGSGKTTLLRLVCGELTPTSGQSTFLGRGVYCAQETEQKPVEAEDFVLDYDNRALNLKRILEIEEEWVWRYDTLSEGERKRLQVAVALWKDPLVLALDEPTNHVDALCRERLIDALAGYKGVGLLVSHDREMLDTLTQQCLFLSGSGAVMRPGTYTEGREQEQLERHSAITERKNAKAELSRLQQIKTARAEEASRADAKRSKRNIAKGDKDAKGRIDLAIYTGQDGKAGKRSAQMDTHVAAAEMRVKQAFVEKSYSADVWLDTEPSHRRLLLELPEGFLAFGSTSVVSQEPGREGGLFAHTPALQAPASHTSAAQTPASHAPAAQQLSAPGLALPHLSVGPKEHIALSGPNGAGKSTLIAALVQAVPGDVRMLYVPQELSFSERQQQLAHLKALSQDQKGRALSIVAQLNSDPDRVLSGNLASPGETRKLMLALGILEQPQLIIMDEPTNHLDILSTEALEVLLAACPCALILVSHDAQFLANTTSIRWEISRTSEGSELTVKY